MHCSHILSLLVCFLSTTSTFFTDAYVLQQDGPGQQVLIGGEPEYATTEFITIHVTSTRTQYEFDFHTKTMTRETRPTPVVQAAEGGDFIPAVMVGMRRLEGWQYAQPVHMQKYRTQECDETACAVCKFQAGTQCHRCDLQPYCQC